MYVNDNACFLNIRAALESIASKLAPTLSTGKKNGALTKCAVKP
jgi:hypothetical protein